MSAAASVLACATQYDEPPEAVRDPSATQGGNGGASSSGGATAGRSSTAGSSGKSTSEGGSGGARGGAPGQGGVGIDGSGASSGGASGKASAGSAGTATGGTSLGNDACPNDPQKTEPGSCGCGVSDTSCAALQDSLAHRYSFEGNANDSVGTAHGTLMGAASINGGALVLRGNMSGDYLDLPDGLISKFSSVTVEAYVTWTGAAGGTWQRIFDFGSSTPQGEGDRYLFLSTWLFRACYNNAAPRAEIFIDSGTPLPTTQVQVAVVVNSPLHTLSLYLNGNSVGSTPLAAPLSAINDVNNWLGRSQFVADEYFAGTISEFRIYSAPLTAEQLKTSLAMGEGTNLLTH